MHLKNVNFAHFWHVSLVLGTIREYMDDTYTVPIVYYYNSAHWL